MRLLLYLLLLLTPSLALAGEGNADTAVHLDQGFSCVLAPADPPPLPADSDHPLLASVPIPPSGAVAVLLPAHGGAVFATTCRTPLIRAPPRML